LFGRAVELDDVETLMGAALHAPASDLARIAGPSERALRSRGAHPRGPVALGASDPAPTPGRAFRLDMSSPRASRPGDPF
jgi:hypothetical protein